MKPLLSVGIAILCLGLGIVIGKTSSSSKNDEKEGLTKKDQEVSQSRSSKRGDTRYSDRRRVGKIGGTPPTSYENRVAHMKALAKKVGVNRGAPDFDALFGVWETAREMNAVELRQAIADLERGSISMQEGLFVKMMLVTQLAKKDGPEAMSYAMNEKNAMMMPMEGMALQAWSGNDPEGAYAWYLSNKDVLKPRESRQFLAGVIAGLAEKDFSAALEKAKNVDSLSRKDVLRSMGTVAADNPERRKEFTDYLRTLEDASVREQAAAALVGELVFTDVKEAIQYVEEWEGDGQETLTDNLASEWAQIEPEKALNWQLNQTGKQNSINNSFGNWARDDADGARKWLSNQEGDLDKDKLRGSAAQRTIWDEDYAGAVQWASSIQDEEQKRKSYSRIYRQWSNNDKEGATQWAETLDETTRNAVVPQESDQ